MNFSRSPLQNAAQPRGYHTWQQADEFHRASTELRDDAQSHFAAGCHFAERQQYAVAIRHLMQALDRAQADGNLRMHSVIFRNLAAIYRELGDAELAQRFQRQTLILDGSAGADDLLDWSVDALLAGRKTLARKLAEEAGRLAADAEDIGVQADAYGQRGVIAARCGDVRIAVRLLIRAARGHDFVRDDRSLGVDLQNLAEVFGLLDRFAWQRAFFAAARECFASAGMTQSEPRAALRLRQAERLECYRRTVAEWN